MEERGSYENLESLAGRDRHAHDFQDSDIIDARRRGHPDLHEYKLNRKGFESPSDGDGERSWVRESYDRESQQAQMIAFRAMNRRRSRLRIFCASFVVLVFSFVAPVSGQVDAAAQKEGVKLTQQLGPLNQVCTGFSENVAGPIKSMLPYNIFYSQGQSFFPAPSTFMRLRALTPSWQPQGGLAVHAPSSTLFLLVRPSKHSPVMEGQLTEHLAHTHRLLH